MPSFEEIAVRYMVDLIRDFRLEDFQAAGFPGNFGVESAGFTDVTENDPVGGGRGGLGHAQWTGSRRVEFEAWLARRQAMGLSAAPDDYAANYSMVFRELEGAEGHRVLPKLRVARNVEEATEIVMREYERPGVPHLDKRKDYGRRALSAFRATGFSVAELHQQGRPGALVLPDAGKLPPLQTDLKLEALLPLILGVLTMLQNRQQASTGKTPDVLELLTSILQQGLQPPPKEPEPAVPPPPTTPPVTQKPSVQLSIAALVASVLGMVTGQVGTPFGMGEAPTTAGTLSVVGSLGSALIGATGGWGALASIGLRLVGALASGIAKRTP